MPSPRREARETRSKELADSVQQQKLLRAPPEAPAAAEAAKAEPAPATAMSAPAPAAAPRAAVARREAAPAATVAAPTDRSTGLAAAPAASAAEAWRRELERVVGDRWRALDGTPPVPLRSLGAAEVGLAATGVVLCEGRPRRCREAALTADEAQRLAEVLPP